MTTTNNNSNSDYNYIVRPLNHVQGFTRTLCKTLESATEQQKRFSDYVYMAVFDMDGNRIYTEYDREIGEAPEAPEAPETKSTKTNNKKKASKYVWIITRTEKEIKTGQEVEFFERVCSNREKVERYFDYIEKVECEDYKNISGEREICASCLHLHLKNEEKTVSIWAKRELIF